MKAREFMKMVGMAICRICRQYYWNGGSCPCSTHKGEVKSND